LKTLKVSERRACRVLGQARTTQRHSPHIKNDEERLVARIIELATQYGRYGYRRITALLRQEGWKVNCKMSGAYLEKGRLEGPKEATQERASLAE
jgi:putative transposase